MNGSGPIRSSHKINIAALGNVVPQLHVHVIARFADDPAWPKAVWGAVSPEPYADDEFLRRTETFKRTLADVNLLTLPTLIESA